VGKSWWNARDLLADERCSRAVLDFLSTTNVGMLVQALGDVAREASDWELRERREREEERRAEAEEAGAAGGAPVPTHARFHGIRMGRGGAVGGELRFLLFISLVFHSRSDSFPLWFPWCVPHFLATCGGQRGACNVPPPRGLRMGKPGKLYAAMIYIGRMRV